MKPRPFKLPRRVVDLLRPEIRADLKRAVKMLEGLQRLQLIVRSAGKSVASSIQITGRTALLTSRATLGSTPKITLACTSESGSATLCGLSEYTTPSLPPKKYRLQTLSGTYKRCSWNNAANCLLSGALGFLVADWREYSGTWTYNASTCSNSNTQVENDYTGVTGAGCPGQGTLQATNAMTNPPFPPIVSGAGIVVTVTPTSWTWTGPGTCQPVAKFSGTVQSVLTNEDTENDAIARATGTTPGTSCTAAHQTRTAGVFTFNFVAVAYDFTCTGLTSGKDYRITYTLLTETYGGGGGVTTTNTLDFTASGASEIISDSLDCPAGKQVTISGASIAAL